MKAFSNRGLFLVVTAMTIAACDCGGPPLVAISPEDPVVLEGDAGLEPPDAGTPEDCGWSQRFGDDDLQSPSGIALAPGGGVVVAGSFFSSISFGSQTWWAAPSSARWTSNGALPGRTFIARLDALGKPVWSKSLGNELTIDGPMVSVDSAGSMKLATVFRGSVDLGGGIMTARDQLDVVIAALDSDGNHRWSRQLSSLIPGGYLSLLGFGTDAAGNSVVLGLRSPGSDVFLIKLDAAGGQLWSHIFPSLDCDGSASIYEPMVVNASGEIFFDLSPTGTAACSIDFGGGPLTIPPRGDNSMLARFDAAGNHRWSRLVDRLNAGTPGFHFAVGRPALSAAGDAYAFGYFGDSIDLGCGPLTAASGNSGTFVASFDDAGQCRWSRQFSPFGSAIAVLPNDGVLLAGSVAGPVDFGAGPVGGANGSLLALELDSQGATVGTKIYGTGKVSVANLLVSTQGEVLITGRLPGAATFCRRTLVSEGSDDVFVVKRQR